MDTKDIDKSEESKKNHIIYYRSLEKIILDIKEVNQLQLGMSKQSVMNLIGSPSIVDPFHQYQWDYINHSTIDGEIEIRYRLRLIFSGNLLSEIDKSGLEELLNSN